AAEKEGNEATMIVRQNQLDAHIEKIRDAVQLYEHAGTPSAKAMSARRAMSKLDYSPSQMEYKVRVAAGPHTVDPADIDALDPLSDKIRKYLSESQQREVAQR